MGWISTATSIGIGDSGMRQQILPSGNTLDQALKVNPKTEQCARSGRTMYRASFWTATAEGMVSGFRDTLVRLMPIQYIQNTSLKQPVEIKHSFHLFQNAQEVAVSTARPKTSLISKQSAGALSLTIRLPRLSLRSNLRSKQHCHFL